MEPVLGFDLQVPARGSRTLLRDLHAQMRAHIVSGRLRPGVQLPSSRELSKALQIGRNTAIGLYDLLFSEGYVVTRPGGGTYVGQVALQAGQARTGKPRRTAVDPESRIASWWRSHQPGWYKPLPPTRFDFSVGLPSETLFPFDVWRRLAARSLRRIGAGASYGDPQGLDRLRSAICGHVSFARAVFAQADDIVVCRGAQQAFELAATILVTPGKTVVAVEDPGYLPLRRAFGSAGAILAHVPVDEEGIVIERIPEDARVVCVTPSHQFPLGMAMSLRRRRALLAWARAHDATVLEDDYDGEFRYGPRPLDALKTLDADGNVFYIGTFSKTMFPALRLGYVVVPTWARQAFVAAKEVSDWHSGTIEQDTLAAFIAEGHLARHLRKARTVYAQRREALMHGVEEHLEGLASVCPSEAGLHIACAVPDGRALQAAASGAESAGLRFHTFRAQGRRGEAGVLLGFGRVDRKDIAPGLRALATLLRGGARRNSS